MGVVCLGRSNVGLVELNRRRCEGAIGIAPFTLQSLSRTKRGDYHFGVILGLKLGYDVWLPLFSRVDANSISCRLGVLVRIRHCKRNVLSVIADDIVLERRSPLISCMPGNYPITEIERKILTDVTCDEKLLELRASSPPQLYQA